MSKPWLKRRLGRASENQSSIKRVYSISWMHPTLMSPWECHKHQKKREEGKRTSFICYHRLQSLTEKRNRKHTCSETKWQRHLSGRKKISSEGFSSKGSGKQLFSVSVIWGLEEEVRDRGLGRSTLTFRVTAILQRTSLRSPGSVCPLLRRPAHLKKQCPLPRILL